MNIFKTKIKFLSVNLVPLGQIILILHNQILATNALANCNVKEGILEHHLKKIISERIKVFMTTIKFYFARTILMLV